MNTEGTPGPARDARISDQEREYWRTEAARQARLNQGEAGYAPHADLFEEAIPRLLTENAALRAERDAAIKQADFERRKFAGVQAANAQLAAAYEAARDEAAGYRAACDRMRERWQMEHDGTLLQSGATQPPLPDPGAPQQLGLGGLGAYASDLGGKP